ncbi:MAG: hypothetical protein L6R39_004167, partial [Caloplaca ligustica]
MSEIAELSIAKLGAVQSGKPATFGGAIKDPALLEKVFTTHTVPDVYPNTRIIAVCGVTDFNDEASPAKDGWFLSDFYAFNFLLNGIGAAQTWVTTEAPEDLVEKYHEYLHGSQLKVRKAVLDNDMLQNHPPQALKVLSRYDLVDAFLSIVKDECDRARDLNQPVLVLLFGHGEDVSYGVELGIKHPSLTERHLIDFPLLHMETFREAIGANVAVTVLSTACFSGGWAVNPRLNTTTMTGAAPGLDHDHPKYITGVSESWGVSDSLGRFCGSIYATAIIESLLSEGAPLVDTEAEPECSKEAEACQSREKQSSTYNAFAESIYRILFTRVDSWAAVHDIRFSAQDDQWEMEWHRRTGLPLSHYADRWAMLREVKPDPDVTTAASRDPSKATESEDMSEVRTGATGSREPSHDSTGARTPRTLSTLRSLVVHEARLYLASFPGRDSLAPNTNLHNQIRKLLRGDPFGFDDLDWVHTVVEYRMDLMRAADTFIAALGIRKPGGQTCSHWDPDAWARSEENRQLDSSNSQLITRAVLEADLFPRPLARYGKKYTKPSAYVSCALKLAGVDAATLQAVIEELVAVKKQAITSKVNTISRFQSIRTAGQLYFKTLGKRLRSLSPIKRKRGISDPHSTQTPPMSPSRG